MKALRLIRKFTEKTHYEILGIPSTASKDEIKKAYYALARSSHPDVTGNEANFLSINLAYEVLSDELKKEAYDKQIKKVQSPGESSKKYTFSAKNEYSKQSSQKTSENNKKQEADKQEAAFTSTGNSNSWSGGLFKQKNSLNSMAGGNPSDAFYMMMRFSLISTGVLVWAYIIYLTVFASYPKKKFEKPEGVQSRLPERGAARKPEDAKEIKSFNS